MYMYMPQAYAYVRVRSTVGCQNLEHGYGTSHGHLPSSLDFGDEGRSCYDFVAAAVGCQV